MSDLPVGVWYLGVVVCFGALVLLVRRDAASYRRQWIADGGTSRSWWIHIGRRWVVWLIISVALVEL